MSQKIHLADFVFTKGKLAAKIIAYSVIVTGDDVSQIMRVDFYKTKALMSLGVEKKNHHDYRLIDVIVLKEVGTGTNY